MAGSPRTGRRRELREVLVDADGVQGAQPDDAAGEPDALRLTGDPGKHDGR
jgi:hypothetical protein